MTRWETGCCIQHGARCTPGEWAQFMAPWLLLQPQQCTLAPVARLGKHARARTHGVFYRESGVESEKVRGGQRAAVHHNPLSKRCFFCQQPNGRWTCATVHNRNTVQHNMALTNASLGLSFPFCSGIRQSTHAGSQNGTQRTSCCLCCAPRTSQERAPA